MSSDEYMSLDMPLEQTRRDIREPTIRDKIKFHVFGYMDVVANEEGVNAPPSPLLRAAQTSRRGNFAIILVLAVLVSIIYTWTAKKWGMPFRTHAESADWSYFGCDSLFQEWAQLPAADGGMAFVTSCYSLFVRNQVCDSMSEDGRGFRTPTESVKMKRDPRIICVLYPFDKKSPYKHSSIQDDGTLVSTIVEKQLWIHYVMPNGDKLGRQGFTSVFDGDGPPYPIVMPFQHIQRGADNATRLTLVYQENRWGDATSSESDPWIFYKPWASPDVGGELRLYATALSLFLLFNCMFANAECVLVARFHKDHSSLVKMEFRNMDCSLSTRQARLFKMFEWLWMIYIWLPMYLSAAGTLDRWYFYAGMFILWIAQEAFVYHVREPRMAVRYLNKNL